MRAFLCLVCGWHRYEWKRNMSAQIKLNLGCGSNHREGYLNVDKYGEPELRHDLEVLPWPWDDGAVSEVVLSHVLEHLGRETAIYLGIIKEIYRICEDGAKVLITVPHPRHDDFLNDPTHVRAVTPESLQLFSKKANDEWARQGAANTPLGHYLDIDLEIENVEQILDPMWGQRMKAKQLSQQDLMFATKSYNNVIKELRITVRVNKSAGTGRCPNGTSTCR